MIKWKIRVKQKGVALVLVLWVLVLLTVMAGSISMTQRSTLTMTVNMKEERIGRALVDAGIEFMTMQLLERRQPTPEEQWPADGLLREWQFNDSVVRIAATPETARVDLNLATQEMLDGLLASAGVDQETIPNIRDAILDWRDPDSDHRLNGVEDDGYEEAGLAYGARDANFLAVDELRQVLGMTNEIYQSLAPTLTVHSRQRTVNPILASERVLRALPGMDADRLAAFLEIREQNREQGLPVPMPAGLNRKYVGKGNVTVYRVYAETQLTEDMGVTAGEAIINIGRGNPKEYKVEQRSFSPNQVPDAAPIDAEPITEDEQIE